ncbi:uncharacterized protein LOC129694357 [Leucoraja erinacea]|uniref:uncharacterized protein LOC129694357 n=1 Tax=Leucoraja erinaceus TaxID=7782 RepID=UPI0024540CFD|nr:uncharacterized protein LOC129694357 [Leucoraja erinacea]
MPLVAAVPEGGNLTLTCRVNNGLRCIFYTDRGDRYIPLPMPQGKTRTSLSLMPVTSDDAGRYVCNCFVEWNEHSVLSALSNVMTLTVNGNVPKPNISFEHTTGVGLVGGSIVIKCQVPAEGEKIVSILKDSEKIYNINSLSESEEYFTFLHLTSRSAGHYQCIYEIILPNKGKSPPSDKILLTILDVHASRSVLNFSASELTVGRSVRMSCHANSTAKCLFFEYEDEDHLGRPMLEATSNNAVEMAKVSLCDSGNYVCLCLMQINGVETISAASEFVTFRVIEDSKGTEIISESDVTQAHCPAHHSQAQQPRSHPVHSPGPGPAHSQAHSPGPTAPIPTAQAHSPGPLPRPTAPVHSPGPPPRPTAPIQQPRTTAPAHSPDPKPRPTAQAHSSPGPLPGPSTAQGPQPRPLLPPTAQAPTAQAHCSHPQPSPHALVTVGVARRRRSASAAAPPASCQTPHCWCARTTHRAEEGTVAGVHLLMGQQPGGAGEALATLAQVLGRSLVWVHWCTSKFPKRVKLLSYWAQV